ncbi:MAG: hypothetical protein ACREEA_05175 [Stellaceae bacterium]
MPNGPHSTDSLHPLIYRVMIGLGVVLWLGIHGFVGGNQANDGLVLVAASLFVIAAVAIQLVMSRIMRRRRAAGAIRSERFRDWLSEEFQLWHDHLKGGDAAFAILLPLVAVSVSMVIFAIELHVVAPISH